MGEVQTENKRIHASLELLLIEKTSYMNCALNLSPQAKI